VRRGGLVGRLQGGSRGGVCEGVAGDGRLGGRGKGAEGRGLKGKQTEETEGGDGTD